jgi:RHS repeat-associated protein
MKLFKQGLAAILSGILLPISAYCGGVVSSATESALNTALSGGGTVTFASDMTITITSVKTILGNTVIDGSGHNVTISGGNSVGIFSISYGVAVTLNNLTLSNGRGAGGPTIGGAVYNQGILIVSNCVFSGNQVHGDNGVTGGTGANGSGSQNGSPGGTGANGDEADGGALFNEGGATAAILNTVFWSNSSTGGNAGNGGKGGNAGPFGSTGGAGGSGGNGGPGNGGAIFNNALAALSLTNCWFTNNLAQGGNGGSGGTNGTGSTYSPPGAGGSGAVGNGGSVYNAGGTISTYACTFNINTAQGGNTATAGVNSGNLNGLNGNPGANGYGGAVYNVGTNPIINCTFSRNLAKGGSGGNGGPSDNLTGGNGGTGGTGIGGNLYNVGVLGATNLTIAAGACVGGAGGLGDTTSPTHGSNGSAGSALGGNIANNTGGTFYLKNSLLGSPSNAANAYVVSAVTDQGNNLSSDTTPSLTQSSSHNSSSINLSTLANNGGPTLTIALLSGSPAINAGDDSAAPPLDQRGYIRIGTSDIGAYEFGGTLPPVMVSADFSIASEDGAVGVFIFARDPVVTNVSYTVNYTIGGTASNGVDYATISNSVTIPAGYSYARVPIRPTGITLSSNKTVALTLASGSQYSIGFPQSDFVSIFPHYTFNAAASFVRGSATDVTLLSTVNPIDYETGVPLSVTGGNASTLFPGNAWTNTLYHYNTTNLGSQFSISNRIPFQNPIVAFGSPVGGSPLYLNQAYRFEVEAGDPALTRSNAFRIQAYYRSNSALAGTISIVAPNPSNSNQMAAFVTNGFTITSVGFGLTNTLLDTDVVGEYILTHSASATATNYYYDVEGMGAGPFEDMAFVLNASGAQDWSRLYVMEFSPFPVLRSTFVDQPQFDGTPLPPEYEGASVEELTNVAPTLPNLSSLIASNYLTIDASPELRRHPDLDQFVQDMGNDPMALANYVINEIDLTDALDYDTNYNSQPAVSLGGVKRGALATFEEGQGSPLEQCALLVYLLRQAGVPAAYVFPTNNGLQMLDFQISKLLGIQLHGALDIDGQTNMPQLISVNYPWVAAYIGTNWVQIFPWLKDISLTEGLDLYEYLPTNYNSGYKWMTHFLANDTNIFSLSDSDQPMDLLPLFIQHSLDANYPGLSVEDFGVQTVNRRHLYAQWSDFPKPFALSGPPLIIESLSINMNLFDTLRVQVYSQANTNKLVDTTEMRALDFHNRKLLLKSVQVGSSNLHNMVLTLSPYSTNITNVAAFGTNVDSTWKLTTTNQLNSTDDYLTYVVTHKRLRFLPSNYSAPVAETTTNFWDYVYFGTGQQQPGLVFQTVQTLFRKGDLVAFCVDAGRVSQKMLNVQAEEIWRFNQNANTNQPSTIDPDIYEGTTAYLLGMSYFNYVGKFEQMCDSLHKVRNLSLFWTGFGLIRPQRDATGALPTNGVVNPVGPAVHMPSPETATVFNGTVRPDVEQDFNSARLDWWLQIGLQDSAAEHGVLRSYYQTNAISTVKLLQTAGTNVVNLRLDNYQAAATSVYNGVQLQNADPYVWGRVVNLFSAGDPDCEAILTPGIVTNGTYVGVGALLFDYSSDFEALVSGLNGGFAYNFPTVTFQFQNAENITVYGAPDNSISPFILQTAPPLNNPAFLVNGASTSESLPGTYTGLVNNQEHLDPSLTAVNSVAQMEFGTSGSSADTYNTLYNTGAGGSQSSAYNDPSQRASDPVNVMNGEYYIDAADLTLPGPMPLQIRRNYGSQNLAENEFGFGWKISYVPFLSLGTNATLIYAAEMDGSFLAYRQTSTNANLWLPTAADNPTLNNNSGQGVGSVANLFNNRLQLAVVSGTNVYTLTGANGSVRTFTVRSYPVGTFTRQRPYLDTWKDSQGNFYTCQYGTNPGNPDYGQLRRIQSSNGNFAGFYYDVYGHVIEAYTGDGRRLDYDYDKYGDLVTVTLPDESQINYQYQHLNQVTNSVTNLYSTHLIIEEDKPDGRMLQNAYDSQRRVTNQMATVGADLVPIRTATFAYTNNFNFSSPTNLLTGVTAVSDYTNNVTSYFYTNSLIRKIVDPLNQTTVQNWFESDTNGGYRRSLQSRIDKRGLQTAYQYDTFGNVITTTLTGDLLGQGNTNDVAVTSATYNTNNLPLAIVDAVGNQMQVIYSTNYLFLPQEVIQFAGTNPVTTNFSVFGNVTNVVTNGTNVSTNIAFGLVTRAIRAYGSVDAATNDTFFNGQGFITNTIQYSGTSDPNITNQFLYNERNELVQRTDSAGRRYVFLYDPMSRPAGQETYEAGASTPMDFNYEYYNDNGELTWTDGPRYNPEDFVWRDYDGAGRKTTEIHWRSRAKQDGSGVESETGDDLYATTFYQYDPLGDLIQTTEPLGNYVVQNYDIISRMTKQVFYASNGLAMKTNGFGYEPGGLVSSITNALGGVTTKLYTSTGKLKFQINPDGSTNAWRFDLSGRPFQEFLRNGNAWQTIYDDLHLKISTVFSNTTSALETNSIQMDHRGNKIQSTDPYGNVFTNLFDGLNRLKIAAGPAIVTIQAVGPAPGSTNYVTNVVQQIKAYIYDSSGQVLTTTNALGEKTVTTSDALGRATQVAIYPSNSVTAVRVASTAYSPDHQSVTVTNGSGTNAIVTTTYSDNDGQPVLSICYPTNGVIEYVFEKYDRLGRHVAQQRNSAASGVVTTWATNGWTYDGLSRVSVETSKDGASTTYGYDALNDVISRAMPGSLSWIASYTNDGRILSEQEKNGATTARSMTYQYYATNSPFGGMLEIVTDGRGTTKTNGYDDFLRLATINSAGSAAEQNTSTTNIYDLRGLVENQVQRYNANPSDLTVGVSRSFDAYGQLGQELMFQGADLGGVGCVWDAAGRRTFMGVENGFSYQADGLMTAAGQSTFGYANNGLLTSRTNTARTYQITQRDGCGRVLQAVTKVGTNAVLTESLTWRNDGRLSGYVATRSGDSTLTTDTRRYGYSALAQRLTNESFYVSTGQAVTNSYLVDQGLAGGLGILTAQAQSGSGSLNWNVPTSGGLDALSRITEAQDSFISRPAWGTASGAETVSGSLDGKPLSIQFGGPLVGFQWRANMDLAAGSHTLQVSAVDASGLISGVTNSTFASATNSGDTILDSYDGNGNVTSRVWVTSLGVTNRTQTLTWDAFNRLVAVTDRDAQSNGINWAATYDGLGRRFYSTSTQVVSNTPTYSETTLTSMYDPLNEFLEIFVGVQDRDSSGWYAEKNLGPDSNGTFGGLQGVGGLETVSVSGHFDAIGVVQDYFGNILGTITNGVVTWNPVRFSGYGPVPGYQQVTLAVSTSLQQSLGWRGKRVDETGLIYLGMRMYDPVAGRFLSADPLGHSASMDLYSFCGGDPINFFDAMGACAQPGADADPYLQFDPRRTNPAFRTIQNGVWTAEEGADAVINGFVALALTPQGRDPNFTVQEAGNWLFHLGGYVPSQGNLALQELSANLGEAGQDLMLAYGAMNGGDPYTLPPEETQWGSRLQPASLGSKPNIFQPQNTLLDFAPVMPDNTMVHISQNNPPIPTSGLDAGSSWAQWSDVQSLTPHQYRIGVVGPIAAGYSPNATTFFAKVPAAGEFTRSPEWNMFGVKEYYNSVNSVPDARFSVPVGPSRDSYDPTSVYSDYMNQQGQQ